MKAKSVLSIILGIFSGLNAQTSPGNSTNTGAIEGRVQNEVTGRYLNNSRITVKGTDLQVFTDESGSYRLANVPSGTNMLEVFYTGLEAQRISVEVPAGRSVTHNVNLAPPGGASVKLDPYVVGVSKVTDQAMIAINEQRFAANIKTVVSTGDLSEQVEGNINEFLKYVPGVSTDHNRAGGTGVSVRGFPVELTEINQDGAKVANAPLTGTTRAVNSRVQMSITNIARVEVVKVPTPANGADTMAGSVNLVSRSAFENVRPEFRYTATLSGEHNKLSLEKKPSRWDKDIYWTRPGFSFTYIHPISKNLGFTISALFDNKALSSENYAPTFNVNSASFGSSVSRPFLASLRYDADGGKGARSSIGITTDWRVTPHSVLSVGVQAYDSRQQNGGQRIMFNTGADATPTVAGGVQGRFATDYTIGATGRGVLTFLNGSQDQNFAGGRGNIRYSFDNGQWKLDVQATQSESRTWLRTVPEEGRVNTITATNTVPLRIEFHNIDPLTGPGEIKVFNNNNELIDHTSPSIHDITAVQTVTTMAKDIRDAISTYNVDLRRKLGFLPFPASVQVGGARKVQDRQWANLQNAVHTYNGPGGSRSAVPFITKHVVTHYDRDYTSLLSPVIAADVWRANPSQFFQTPAQFATTENARRLAEEFIKETADALYFQTEVRLLKNRLNVLTGLRYEKTTGRGEGALDTPDAVFVRNANGSFALTPAGARIRKPEAGAPGSLAEVELTRHERAAHSNRSYDGAYPSLHLTYNIAENLLVRGAYAKTYGRPDFSFIIPRTQVIESLDAGGSVIGGTLVVRNPGLRPWTADNYDLSLEYYTNQGGVFGASVFQKNVTDFFGAETRDATPEELSESGLDPSSIGWQVRSTMNVGDARVDGWELSMNQSLSPLDRWLAGWGSSLRVFANVTKLKLSGERTADFAGFVPTSANWGVHFARKRLGVALKWNYRSEQNTAAITTVGTNGFNYTPKITTMDANFSYSLTPNLALFTQLRNATLVGTQPSRKSDELPAYARLMLRSTWDGVATTFGIKGSF